MGKTNGMPEKRGITDEDLLDVLRDRGGAGTAEVADALDCSRQNADYRLRRLLDDGKVHKRTVGNSLLWTAVDE